MSFFSFSLTNSVLLTCLYVLRVTILYPKDWMVSGKSYINRFSTIPLSEYIRKKDILRVFFCRSILSAFQAVCMWRQKEGGGEKTTDNWIVCRCSRRNCNYDFWVWEVCCNQGMKRTHSFTRIPYQAYSSFVWCEAKEGSISLAFYQSFSGILFFFVPRDWFREQIVSRSSFTLFSTG